MRLVYSIFSELKRNIINLRCLLLSVSAAMICFMTYIYSDRFGRNYTVAEALFLFDKEFLLKESITFENVFMLNLSGVYSGMFFSILSSVSCITVLCQERKSGYLRFIMNRESIVRYSVSKYIAAIISGGCVILLGTVIFALVAMCKFPFSESISTISLVSIISRHLLRAFIYGGFSVLPAVLISSFLNNIYLIVCFPYMLSFIHTTTITKLIAQNGDAPGIICDVLIELQLSNLCYIIDDFSVKKCITCIVIIIFVYTVFYLGIKGRCDYAQ